MSARLHHLIIPVSDREAAVDWLVDLLELREPWENGFFSSVQLDDAVVLNVAAPPAEIQPQHYAFLVRRLYFRGPSDLMLEVLTVRYNSVPAASRSEQVR